MKDSPLTNAQSTEDKKNALSPEMGSLGHQSKRRGAQQRVRKFMTHNFLLYLCKNFHLTQNISAELKQTEAVSFPFTLH